MDIVKILEPFRSRDPNLVADIEAALNTSAIDSFNYIDLRAVENAEQLRTEMMKVSPNLWKWFENNNETENLDIPLEQFQQLVDNYMTPSQFARLITEFNKLPSNSPYLRLNLLMSQLCNWASAEKDIGQPRQKGLFGG